jgi:preprotein translocase subunit SecE
MATKTAIEKGEERSAKRQEPGALAEFGGGAMGKWNELTGFLRDVRAEMRKVVTPSWKEVKVTTAVVIVATFLFGLFFFIVDNIFNAAITGPHGLLSKLGGLQ